MRLPCACSSTRISIPGVKPAFAKVRAAIEADDFKSPDVKKLHVGGYYRAKLDHSNRLLLQFVRHDSETVCLVLEVIANHAYKKSRFLRGAPVDEAKIELEPLVLSAESGEDACAGNRGPDVLGGIATGAAVMGFCPTCWRSRESEPSCAPP